MTDNMRNQNGKVRHVIVTGGVSRRVYGAEMRRKIEREMQSAWVHSTGNVPGAASYPVRAIRAGRRSPWVPQLAGIAETLERAAILGEPEAVAETAERLLAIPDVYASVIRDIRDELIARQEAEQKDGPKTPAQQAGMRRAA